MLYTWNIYKVIANSTLSNIFLTKCVIKGQRDNIWAKALAATNLVQLPGTIYGSLSTGRGLTLEHRSKSDSGTPKIIYPASNKEKEFIFINGSGVEEYGYLESINFLCGQQVVGFTAELGQIQSWRRNKDLTRASRKPLVCWERTENAVTTGPSGSTHSGMASITGVKTVVAYVGNLWTLVGKPKGGARVSAKVNSAQERLRVIV